MNNVLKVTRNGQILEVILDRPKANAIDAKSVAFNSGTSASNDQ